MRTMLFLMACMAMVLFATNPTGVDFSTYRHEAAQAVQKTDLGHNAFGAALPQRNDNPAPLSFSLPPEVHVEREDFVLYSIYSVQEAYQVKPERYLGLLGGFHKLD